MPDAAVKHFLVILVLLRDINIDINMYVKAMAWIRPSPMSLSDHLGVTTQEPLFFRLVVKGYTH